jgi:uncharacterized protein YbaR (Trm112 family)
MDVTLRLWEAEPASMTPEAVRGLIGQTPLFEITGHRTEVVIRDAWISDGWVEVLVSVPDPAADFLLHYAGSDDYDYSIPTPAEAAETLLRMFATPAVEIVTPNCPVCGTPGMMLSSTQAACPVDECKLWFWNVTKTAEENLANVSEAKIEHHPLDPEPGEDEELVCAECGYPMDQSDHTPGCGD